MLNTLKDIFSYRLLSGAGRRNAINNKLLTIIYLLIVLIVVVLIK